MMLWKCYTQYAIKFGKLNSGYRIGKCQFSFQSQRKVMPKNAETTTQLHFSHMLENNAQNSPSQSSTVHELWTSRCSSCILKRQRNRDQIALHWIIKKSKRVPKKKSTSAALTMPKPLTVWITINCEKLLKRWEYQTTWPVSWEICMQVKKQELELDMEKETGSKSGKEYIKAVYYPPAYLTYMQSTSCKMLGWMKHKLESRLPREISITSNTQMTPPLC